MSQYVCSICGYVYDDEKELIKFDKLDSTFTCPLCGAPKSAFEKVGEEVQPIAESHRSELNETKIVETETELSYAELYLLFSNLAKGFEKQYRGEEAALCLKLAAYYHNSATKKESSELSTTTAKLAEDITSLFPKSFELAKREGDRGSLRALTWAEKVSKMLLSLLQRFADEGDSFLKATKIFVCEICGFVYVGSEAPKICPVCKVPQEKIHEVIL